MVGTVYFKDIEKLLATASGDRQLFDEIVNAPFHDRVTSTQPDLGIVFLLQVNTATNTIDRIALSNTEQAQGTVKMSEKPFTSIKIPIDYEENAIAKAIATGEPQIVTDWKYLFIPAMSPGAARFNQAGGGIECSCVYPLKARDGGALIFSYYQISRNIGPAHRGFMESYVDLVANRLKT